MAKTPWKGGCIGRFLFLFKNTWNAMEGGKTLFASLSEVSSHSGLAL